MSFAVRELLLDFDSPARAAGWVAEHSPSGLVFGSARWQLVIHDDDSAQVRLLVAFADVAAARDWAQTPLPELDGAGVLTVRVGQADAYVAGNQPGEEGPGRVWVPSEHFPPES